jgi:hypothetical protein
MLCLASLSLAQHPGPKLTDGGERLVTVTAKPDHRDLRRGNDLGVTLTIKAGSDGAYLPDFFRDWDETCQSGFSVYVYTLQGNRASTTVRSCAASFLTPGPPAKELLADYVLLRPGETRSWHTTLTNIAKSPGTYEIKAEYFSAQQRIQEVAALQEVHGLMVVGHIRAKPVLIRIR